MTVPRNLFSQSNTIWAYYSLTDILPCLQVAFEFRCLVVFTHAFFCSCYFLFFLVNILASIQNRGLHCNISYHSLASPFHPPNRLPSVLLTYKSFTLLTPSLLAAQQCLNYTTSMCLSLSSTFIAFSTTVGFTVEAINNSSAMPLILGLDHQDPTGLPVRNLPQSVWIWMEKPLTSAAHVTVIGQLPNSTGS